jgi:DNA-binding beta-propeller fold protein YncE
MARMSTPTTLPPPRSQASLSAPTERSTPIAGTILSSEPAGSTNLDLAASGDGKFLYTLNSGTGSVSIYSINSNGTLNQLGNIEGLPKTVGFNGIAAL